MNPGDFVPTDRDATPVNVVSEARTLRRLMRIEQTCEERLADTEAEYRGGLRSIRRSLDLRCWIFAVALVLAFLLTLGFVYLRQSDRVSAGQRLDRLESILMGEGAKK